LNLEILEFKEFFVPRICVERKNAYGEFHPIQAGGRMVPYGDDQVLFSIGDYRFRDHAQDETNVFGKIVAINIRSRESKIISMGHRNVQGLTYLEEEDIVISTEHGPAGGDEINVQLSPSEKIANYGWPISSYGHHYGLPDKDGNHPKYRKAPLHGSHSDYGFDESVKYFVPSIGISEVVKISRSSSGTNHFLVAAMGEEPIEGDMSIYDISFDNDFTMLESRVIPLNERVRDMIYSEEIDKVFLFMETTASIGILELN
jgi:hypothetical protein